jgi:hypothetical protein
MDWERIDSTVRQAYRKNGKELDTHRGARTPLSDLIAKDPFPDLHDMTEPMLCEFAAENHIAIEEGLSREEMIDAIKESLEVNWAERLRGMRGMLDYIYEDGPHPLCVYRRLMSVVKAVRPQLTLNMSCAQLAILCDDGKGTRKGDGRATVSARIQRLFDEPIKKAGMKGYKASFQKTESACANYSDSAQGNRNRLGRDFLEASNNGHR